jgi:cytochrome c553
MKLRLPILAASLLAALPGFAADIEAGRQLAYTCTGCHGITGYKNVYPHYNVPRIGGQTKEYLVLALTAYQTGERSHPTMRAQGEGLSEQEIEQISEFLASLGGPQQ